MSRVQVRNLLFLMLAIALSAGIASAQSGFTYQGRLTDGGSPANGNYDLQFALFDAADGSNQIGQTKIVSAVPVSAGIFTVTLDFGANAFSGASRFLEISARPSGAGGFVLLTPRQPITSTPYAVRSLNAGNADNAQQLGGVDAGQYVKTNDARMSDARDPKAGNSSYVQNSTNQQAATNFNVSGNGTVGGALSGNTVNATTQYNLAGQPALSLSSGNLKIGSTGNVGIGSTSAPFYKLEVVSPDRYGLRVGAITSGGAALSIGGTGKVEVDAPGNAGGRFNIQENGNVGIGMTTPTSKLTVQGEITSSVGGFRFPDGSVQTNAVGKTYTITSTTEVEIAHTEGRTDIASLMLPPGTYFITATVELENRANDFFPADNSRKVRCFIKDVNFELMGTNHMGAPGNPMDFLTTDMHTVSVHSFNSPVSLLCGNMELSGKVFAKIRRLTAIRISD